MTRQDFFYVMKPVEDGPHNGMIKIGHSVDPVRRRAQHQTGSHVRLEIAVTFQGGKALEKEFKRLFVSDKVDTGGDEWYKVSREITDWLRDTTIQSLIVAPRSDINFGGPISIQRVELAEAKAPQIQKAASISSVQQHEIVEASLPKSPYAKVGTRKNKR